MNIMPFVVVCSRTLYFKAVRDFPDCEVLLDHYTPGDYLYYFIKGKGPVDFDEVKKREESCPMCGQKRT